MKKSELIKFIADYLKSEFPNQEPYKANAVTIIDICEDFGMLPPVRDVIIEGHECDSNTWEKE